MEKQCISAVLEILVSATIPQPEKETIILNIIVHGNDIEKALRDMKRTIQKDGIFKELKNRRFYEKPSVKKKRKQLEAARRRRKALRFKRPERD